MKLSKLVMPLLVALALITAPSVKAGTIDPGLLDGDIQVVIQFFDLGAGEYEISVLSELPLDSIVVSISNAAGIGDVTFINAGFFANPDAGEDVLGSRTISWNGAFGGVVIAPDVVTTFAMLTGSGLAMDTSPAALALLLAAQATLVTSDTQGVSPANILYVPEPRALVLIALGLAGLAFVRRPRRVSSATPGSMP